MCIRDSSFTVDQYDTLKLTLMGTDGNPIENVTWSIKGVGGTNRDPAAGVSPNSGVVLGYKAGTVTVVATANELGTSAEQEITVNAIDKDCASFSFGAKATAISQADAARGPEKGIDEISTTMWRACLLYTSRCV